MFQTSCPRLPEWINVLFSKKTSFIIIFGLSSSIPTITLFTRFELDFAPSTKQTTLGKVDATTCHDIFDSFSTIKEHRHDPSSRWYPITRQTFRMERRDRSNQKFFYTFVFAFSCIWIRLLFSIFNSTVKFIQVCFTRCIIRKHIVHNARYFIPINADTVNSLIVVTR